MTLIDIAQQCCDADDYLDTGYVCAKAGLCYNALRPVGDSWWFGIPYFFDTHENIFFYLHAALLLLVLTTALRLFKMTASATNTQHYFLRTVFLPSLFATVVIILAWPTLFHPLSDTPAALLFLEGCLLALVGVASNRAAVYLAAGLCLGCSALLRAAYFLPLSIAAAAFLFAWLVQAIRHPGKSTAAPLFMFSFILPIAFQFYTTWKYTGHWNFLPEAHGRQMLHLHLDSTVAGYDTALPQTGIFWQPDCLVNSGLLPSLQHQDMSSAVCLLENRLMFYLGSYAADTYSNPYRNTHSGEPVRNFLDNQYAEKIGHRAGWLLHGVHTELSSALSPLHDMTASRLVPDNTRADDPDDPFHFVEARSLFPLPPGNYRFSIWLWSANPHSQTKAILELNNTGIVPATNQDPVEFATLSHQQHAVSIGDTPQQFVVDFKQDATGYLSPRIVLDNPIYAWGAALEPVATASGYHRAPEKLQVPLDQTYDMVQTGRYFSITLMAINALVIVIAFLYLLRAYRTRSAAAVLFVAALIFASLAQCVLVIPEQRYFQGALSACWLMCCLWLSSVYAQRK